MTESAKTETPNSETRDLWIAAALDGELSAMESRDFEAALAADPLLKARYAQLAALKSALRDHAQSIRSPEAFRARIEAMAFGNSVSQASPRAAPLWPRRAAMAAALVLAFGAGATIGPMLDRTELQSSQRLALQIVDNHRRSLLAREQTDVASSDRHSVKPWFDARLALSPPVIDLASQGFPLVGGRADVVDGVPIPTIVYRLREHFVSLAALPQPRFATAATSASIAGYQVLSWSEGGFVYWAVSDMPPADLAAFEAAFRAGIAVNAESR